MDNNKLNQPGKQQDRDDENNEKDQKNRSTQTRNDGDERGDTTNDRSS